MGKSSTQAQNKYIAKAYDRINLTVPKGQKDVVQAYAAARGESVNGFIGRAIAETMGRDSGGAVAPESAQVERVLAEMPTVGPQKAAETAQGAGAVSVPSDVLEAAQRAAHVAGESVGDFMRRAVERQARRDSAGPSSMIVLSPELVRDATVGGFAVGESTREFVMRAVRELVERERPGWDEETLRFQDMCQVAHEKGIACLPPGAFESVFNLEKEA